MGSLKASYTFLLSLPLRTHELSSLPLLPGDQDQTQVCRVLVFVLRLGRRGCSWQGVGPAVLPLGKHCVLWV